MWCCLVTSPSQSSLCLRMNRQSGQHRKAGTEVMGGRGRREARATQRVGLGGHSAGGRGGSGVLEDPRSGVEVLRGELLRGAVCSISGGGRASRLGQRPRVGFAWLSPEHSCLLLYARCHTWWGGGVTSTPPEAGSFFRGICILHFHFISEGRVLSVPCCHECGFI